MAGIITGVSKLEKGWIIYQLHLPSISTTIAVPFIWSSPPPIFIHLQYFLWCSEGHSAVSIWHHSTSPSVRMSSMTIPNLLSYLHSFIVVLDWILTMQKYNVFYGYLYVSKLPMTNDGLCTIPILFPYSYLWGKRIVPFLRVFPLARIP